MMENKQLVPELRFPEFEGEWVEKRIADLFKEFKSGNGITASDISEEGMFPVYGGNGLRGYTNTYTHDGFYLLIGRQGALCGNINRSYSKAFVSEHAIACKANDSSDTEWLAQRLDFFNLNRLSESSAQPGLSVSKLLRFKLIVPQILEQQKIASFLTAVDERIQLLQQKQNKLESYRKSIMQKLFSQELRFKDEQGNDFPDWEEKKLGEVADIKRGAASQHLNYKDMGIRLLRINDFLNNTPVYVEDTSDMKRFRVKTNDLLIAGTGATAGIVFIVPEKFNNLSYSYNAPRIRVKTSFYKYVYYYLKSDIILRQQKALFVGNAQPFLDTSAINGFKIEFPSFKEQQKIASFLSAIGESIEKVGQQLAQMQDFKKGLLQKMFV